MDQHANDRRNFLRIAIVGSVALISSGVGAAGILLPPAATEAPTTGPRPLVPLLRLGAINKDEPLGLDLSISVRDGWRLRTRRARVFVVRLADGDAAASFKALSGVCPHAGCGIEYKADDKKFICPCHGAEFDPHGASKEGPSPRDMDPFEVSIAEHQGAAWLHVDWQEFVTGTAERTPKARA